MSIKFTSKNVKFPGALKGYAEKSLKNIEKFSGGIIDSEVVVSEEKSGFKIEINVKCYVIICHYQVIIMI